MAKLQFKLTRIVSRHDQLKVSFNHLKSHIKTGLLEAEDVFSSLAVPLMKLVGLKSDEMAGEGRSNTFSVNIRANDQVYVSKTLMTLSLAIIVFFFSNGFNFWFITCGIIQYEFQDMIRENTHKSMSTGKRGSDLHKLEEETTNNAIMAGNEVIHKQKQQLIQLVKLLKQVENCVKSSRKNMFQTIDDHKARIHMFLRKAVTYISVIQQSTHDGQAPVSTFKLLKAFYDLVTEVLSSVEGGVDNLINELNDEMCKPMIEYVKSCKAEMTIGTCPRLLVALEDMKEVAKDGRVELEYARKMVRVAEERKIEALSMLRESEENIKKMRRYLELSNDKKATIGQSGRYAKNKLLAPAPQEDQTKDDKLLWELLKKKRICQQPESPFGPTELFHVGTSTKNPNPTTGKPSITHSHRPTTRAYSKMKTHSSGSLLALGLSPALSLSRK
ncbi:uncharacterized protein LOC143608577 [Bidens hawaiensis]|uniref:uncharacterized protein LOC143608577 n=1 Tax=Bidens hawaiensis TaxID=980011 RepID=UPI00404B48BD